MSDIWDILKAIVALVSNPETRTEAILALVGTALLVGFASYRIGRFLQTLVQNKHEARLQREKDQLHQAKMQLERDIQDQHIRFQETVDPLRQQVSGLTLESAGLRSEAVNMKAEHEAVLDQLNESLSEAGLKRSQLEEQLASSHAQLTAVTADLERHQRFQETLMADDGQLWSMRQPKPPSDFHARLLRSHPKIVTIGNLKGGVGKTMLTSTLAAFFDEYYGLRVLVLDLDYQGTLTDMLYGAANAHPNGSQVDGFLLGTKGPEDFIGLRTHLPTVLSNTHIVGSEYELSRSENRALIKWLLNENETDLRYRLATLLLDPVVQEHYDIVLLDTPPRLGPASLNALCASHMYFVPTILDRASAEAATKFVGYVDALMPGLNLDLKFGGVIANSTDEFDLTDTEKDSRALIENSPAMNGRTDVVFDHTIRYTKKLHSAAGNRILYSRDKLFREGMADKVGREVAKRLGLDIADENRSVA